MMGIRPKQFARLGEFHLEEAILDVLLQVYCDNICMGASDISQRAGVYREAGVVGMNDAVVTGLLNKLYETKHVEKCSQDNGRGGWKLTAAEFERRKDD